MHSELSNLYLFARLIVKVGFYCGFTVLGADPKQIFATCGSEECLLHFARHHAPQLPVTCGCPQREFPHELNVHFELRTESFNPKFRNCWPWSLCLSARLEPSAERKQG
jgi:hypothetical protein